LFFIVRKKKDVFVLYRSTNSSISIPKFFRAFYFSERVGKCRFRTRAKKIGIDQDLFLYL